jgi:hypothetical protein
MGLGFGIWLVILGMLGASSIIIAKKPDAAELIAKFAPYQGWMGAVSVLWGIYGILWSFRLLGVKFIYGVTYLATSGLLISLGLLLGVGVLKTFIKDAKAQAGMDKTIAKLAPFQGTLGFISIGLGVWTVLMGFLF